MKKELPKELLECRLMVKPNVEAPLYIRQIMTISDENLGCFQIKINNKNYFIRATKNDSWDHISVSVPENKFETPSWEVMCIIKNLFFEEDECVVQYHPVKKEYVNFHSGTLHLWKPQKEHLITPPKELVL